MDLVICPTCRFAFSPTPGKAVKCPACMAVITPGADAPRPRATQRDPRRAAPALASADSSNNLSRSALFGISLLTIALIGSGFALLKSTSPSDADPTKVAATTPVPEILVPKSAPQPQPA